MTRGGERDMVLYQGSSHTFSSSLNTFSPCEHLTLYVWGALTLVYLNLSTTRHWHPSRICVCIFFLVLSMMCVGWPSERWWSVGGEWLHHNCSWVEGGRTWERRWSLPSSTCCVWEEEREPEMKTHVRKCLKNTSAWDRHIPHKFYITNTTLFYVALLNNND